MNKRLIVIRDETLRDGAQQPGINLTSKDRYEIAFLSAEILNSSSNTKNNQIDLGMPEVSEKLLKNLKDTSKAIVKKYNGIDLFVTGRATKDAIDAMCDSLNDIPTSRKIIAPFLGISQTHREKLGLTKKEVLLKIKDAVEYSKKYITRIHFPLEAGFYAYLEDRNFVYEIFSLLSDLGVEAVPFCDTVGIALPFSRGKYISYGFAIDDLRRHFPKLQISVHCHNDLGLAVANTIEGLLMGAEIADGTYFGIGERAGNASLETLLVAISEKENHLGLRVQANLKKLYPLSLKIKKILKIKIADNTPVIGKNAFTHASGIHQDGTLKNKEIYQPYEPKIIGRKGHKIVLGHLSGKRGIEYILRNKFDIQFSEKILLLIVKKFKEVEDFEGNPEQQLQRIAKKYLNRKKRI
ncbi:hypothetical protein A2627_04225 [Candidatus Woesebacteria bacterium RIFCSPHIGHO2_01_FULL_39_28]|uniref:2-isopropylmalate synthase n=1 Tax=Candidatus Woesebacteria bacterium RIFCSPHIGHO2_01_FULL_39_28 TaxID=1802496 RepID=A0A1F7YHB7_9BACT|nr:MAG: hypothetical protein A2627_04225 [Candidatus Woesebacteria bacterium RIFCSPHIGHO2_01_FULL_39_28]OGM58435.1 MAG: hypothetical protein A3A50_01000 [Candidatus Woesebacteria bacterium RIFCSPLOWO2_01_FULL_38_20]